jgi:hypothetical protein
VFIHNTDLGLGHTQHKERMPNSPGGILIPKEVFGCIIERDRPRAGCPHRAIQKWQRSARA